MSRYRKFFDIGTARRPTKLRPPAAGECQQNERGNTNNKVIEVFLAKKKGEKREHAAKKKISTPNLGAAPRDQILRTELPDFEVWGGVWLNNNTLYVAHAAPTP